MRVRGGDEKKILSALAVQEKSVPGRDEDAVTMGVAAAQNALVRSDIQASEIGAIYVGSESHPYAVKPSATLLGQALGVGDQYFAVDMEFACKSGTAAMQTALAFVASGMCDNALAVGSDTAQAAPGDILEYTASAGGGAFIFGNDERKCIATVEDTISITTDTPDFWRRSMQKYPQHTGRFTALPAYFRHVIQAATCMLEKQSMKPEDFDFVVFHQPNAKFPVIAAHKLGFTQEQYKPALLAHTIGNPYSANALLGLAQVLDQAQPNQHILVVSYGSGSGSDAFVLKTTERLALVQDAAKTTEHYIKQKEMLTYHEYEKRINGEVA